MCACVGTLSAFARRPGVPDLYRTGLYRSDEALQRQGAQHAAGERVPRAGHVALLQALPHCEWWAW